MSQKPMQTADLTPGGRPTIFTAELAAEICTQLAAGKSLRHVCRPASMPAESTVRNWALANEEFGKAYREARDLGLDAMADETLDISDDGTNDTQVDGDGNVVTNYDHIQRSRLRVDTRKWYLSKLAPKRYGDLARVEHTGADGKDLPAPTTIDVMELARQMALGLEIARRRVTEAGDGAKVINQEGEEEPKK